jgi:hypothetical protein
MRKNEKKPKDMYANLSEPLIRPRESGAPSKRLKSPDSRLRGNDRIGLEVGRCPLSILPLDE